MSVLIAPSILSADFARLGEAVAAAERGGADLIHVDVMDGHFVPNITIGVPVVKSLKRIASVPLDVHLMIEDPDRYIEAFADAGAGDDLGAHRGAAARASHGPRDQGARREGRRRDQSRHAGRGARARSPATSISCW